MGIPFRSHRKFVVSCCGLILFCATSYRAYARSPRSSTPQSPAAPNAQSSISPPPVGDGKSDQAQDNTKPSSTPATAPHATPMPPKEARQAQLEADSAALLELAQQLKAEVDKSNKDTLSLSVIRKATEVEKMARNLKEQMRSQ